MCFQKNSQTLKKHERFKRITTFKLLVNLNKLSTLDSKNIKYWLKSNQGVKEISSIEIEKLIYLIREELCLISYYEKFKYFIKKWIND